MPTASSAHESLRARLLDAVWRQWAALDSPATAEKAAEAIIDPEALILASLGLIEQERRLWDVLAWWGRSSSRLLSLQRIKNLVGDFGDETETRLGEFAQIAFEDGNDARWKTLPRSAPAIEPRRSKLDAPASLPRRRSTLMLLLRRGIGVGIKPDLLTVLIGSEGRPRNVRSLARETAFSNRAVRRAAEEMAEARLIRVAQDSPVTYSADAEAWLSVLQLDPPAPRWIPWHRVFPLSSQLVEVLSRLEDDGARYAATSRLRDLVERYASMLGTVAPEAPDPSQHRGEEYLEPFLAFVPRFEAWLTDSV